MTESPAGDATADEATLEAMTALLLAQKGYRAAAEAVDAATVPSLTDFVD